MTPLHAAVISLYNHHRTIACRDAKHEVQDICNTDVYHIKSASAFFHTPFVMVFFYERVFAYSNWSKILKNCRGWHWRTNEFSQESDSDASRQNWTDGRSGGRTRDYRSRCVWQCVIVIAITSERKSYNRSYVLSLPASWTRGCAPHVVLCVLWWSVIRVVKGNWLELTR